MISELVRDNMGAFLSIISIYVVLLTLTDVFVNMISYRYLGTSLLGINSYMSQMINPNTTKPNMLSNAPAGKLIIFIFITSLIGILISAFTEGGFLSYMHRGISKKKDYVVFFFESAVNKWGRMIGASIIQQLIMFVTLVVIYLFSALLGTFINQADYNGFIALFSLFIGIPLLLACMYGLICIPVFTWFITFESACTDETVGKWISNSFTKAKKVFWPMFLWVTVVIIFSSIIYVGLYFGQIAYHLSYIIYSIIVVCLTAYVFYPLYRLASERHNKQLKENEKVHNLEDEIWAEESE